jgi:hypothetical protein
VHTDERDALKVEIALWMMSAKYGGILQVQSCGQAGSQRYILVLLYPDRSDAGV